MPSGSSLPLPVCHELRFSGEEQFLLCEEREARFVLLVEIPVDRRQLLEGLSGVPRQRAGQVLDAHLRILEQLFRHVESPLQVG